MRCWEAVVVLMLALSLVSGKEEQVPRGHRDHHDPLDGEEEIDGERNVHRDHEAVLGSRREAEEADDLSPEEAKELLEKLAKKHDKDGDGKISRQEFIDWILESLKSLDAEEAEDRMREEDDDGDKRLTWAEYIRSQYDYEQEDLDRMKQTPNEEDNESMMEMVEDDRVRFKAADLNGDEVLDKAEYVAFYHPYDYEHMHALEIERGVKDVDKDKDGVVTMAEYVGEVDDKETQETEETQFKEYDLDGDGVLRGEELKKWLIPDNMDTATDEVDHLMSVADADNDTFLDFKEIVEHQEEFVSSQATDYGTTLQRMKDEL